MCIPSSSADVPAIGICSLWSSSATDIDIRDAVEPLSEYIKFNTGSVPCLKNKTN